ncbi:MAG: decaprenyl-phosphate phosphoribosyltransferase [bacterium]
MAPVLVDILRLIRPKQWIKNFFVLAPLALSYKISSPETIRVGLMAFLVFCVAASAVYVWNDIIDRKRDCEHPTKRTRPIASGKISLQRGILLALFLLAAGLIAAYKLDPSFLEAVAAYFVLNLLYSLYLKHIVLIDLFALAGNYVLRVLAGTLVINEVITPWVIILATLLALFLAIGKRRGEYLALQQKASEHRKTLADYHPYFLDQLNAIITSLIVMAWILYTMDPAVQMRLHSPLLPLTIPLVLYGVFRYQFIIHRKGGGESPSQTFLTDPPLLITVGLWFFLIVHSRVAHLFS